MKSSEKYELLVSWLTISIAFAWVMSNDGFARSGNFISILPIALAAVGTGFILHELSHKYVAIHFGAHAEYHAWNIGLIIALATALFGFVFAAPGATYVFGNNISVKQNALISLAGPATNILIAIAALLALQAVNTGYIAQILQGVFFVNLFLALFNMLPIFPLDGSKVFAWSKAVWAAFFLPLAFFFIFGGLI